MNRPATPDAPAGRRRHPRWLVVALAAPLVAMLAQALLVAVVCMVPSRQVAPLSWDLRAEAASAGGARQLEVAGGPGRTLSAELLGDPARPLVVYAHPYRANRRQVAPLARALLARGYAVLAFDFRGCGDSDGALTFAGAAEADDVLAVLRHVHGPLAIPAERVAWVGASMGAAAFLMADRAAADQVGAAVLLAPYGALEEAFDARTRHYAGLCARPWFRPAAWLFGRLAGRPVEDVRPRDHVRALAGLPSLWVGGSRDWRAPARDVRDMAEAAGDRAAYLAVDGADHLDVTRPVPAVVDAILDFLETNLPR